MIVLLTGNDIDFIEKIYDEFINSNLMDMLDIYKNQTLTRSMNKIAIVTEEEIEELLSKNKKEIFSIYSIGCNSKFENAITLNFENTIDGLLNACKTILEDNFQIVHGKWNQLND